MEYEAGWAPDMVLHFERRENLLLPGFETYVCMEWCESFWTDIHKIWYWGFLLKFLGFVEMDQ